MSCYHQDLVSIRRHPSNLVYLLNKLILKGNYESCYFWPLPLMLLPVASLQAILLCYRNNFLTPRQKQTSELSCVVLSTTLTVIQFKPVDFDWQAWGIKSSPLADPMIGVHPCQPNTNYIECSILVEQKPGKGRVHILPNELLSGELDISWMVTSSNKCENWDCESVQGIWQHYFTMPFLSKLHFQNCFLSFGDIYVTQFFFFFFSEIMTVM